MRRAIPVLLLLTAAGCAPEAPAPQPPMGAQNTTRPGERAFGYSLLDMAVNSELGRDCLGVTPVKPAVAKTK